MTLTIDQLRAYLERREREASEMKERTRAEYNDLDGTPGGDARWEVYRATFARWNVYRELLEAIESGVLPS